VITPNNDNEAQLASTLHTHYGSVMYNDLANDSMANGTGPFNLETDTRSPLCLDQNQNDHVQTLPNRQDTANTPDVLNNPSPKRNYLCARLVRAHKAPNEALDASMSSGSESTKRKRVKVRAQPRPKQTQELVSMTQSDTRIVGNDIPMSEDPTTSTPSLEVTMTSCNLP